MNRILLTIILVLLSIFEVQSQEKAFIREYTYIAGETDSKVTARQKALEQVKVLLIEELGTYIETWANYNVAEGEEINESFFKQEIKTISAGITETKVIDETWNGYEFYVKAQMEADPNEVVRRINQTLSARRSSAVIDSLRLLIDNSADEIKLRSKELDRIRDQLNDQKKEVEEKENAISSLNRQLANAKRDLNRYQEEEQRIISELKSIQNTIQKSTNKAIENVILGMTPEEVIKVAGKPRTIDDCRDDEAFNYGRVWVIIESGVVSLIIDSRDYRSCTRTSWYRIMDKRIIKGQ
ncbi:MAG: hypothetical protein WDZ80_00505 [Candidatus Paceibacterota bacterium]